jgi:acetyl-CoA synthetase
MPMCTHAVYAMLACARIGASHSVVFAGFSADALMQRIDDASSRVVLTADQGLRGGKKIGLKRIVDEAIEKLPDPALVETVSLLAE